MSISPLKACRQAPRLSGGLLYKKPHREERTVSNGRLCLGRTGWFLTGQI